MSTFGFKVSILIGKLIYSFMQVLGRTGGQLPGVIVERIYPDFLKEIQTSALVIGITGTNGKTTTTNLTYEALCKKGYRVISNLTGSNTSGGVISTLLPHLKFSGQVDIDIILLETDEKASRRILPKFHYDYLAVTNLFRDSYDRNAHPDHIREILNQAIDDQTHLILNADDLLSFDLKENNDRSFFSMSALPDDSNFQSNVIDISNCPICEYPLETVFKRYHHIGRYYCPNCGFENPVADYELTAVNSEAKQLTIQTKEGKLYDVPFIGQSETDAYNQLIVIAILGQLDIDLQEMARLFTNMSLPLSRFEKWEFGGLTLYCQLAKGMNPTASSRVFSQIAKNKDQKVAVIIANTDTGEIIDRDYDERNNASLENIGWLHEIDMEYLAADHVKQVIITGKRSWDYAVRAELAGIDSTKVQISYDPRQAANLVDLDQVDTVYFLYDIFTKVYGDIAHEILKERVKNR